MIARGTPRELIASLGVDHIVEFSMEDAARLPAIARLEALPGVRAARIEAGRVSLSCAQIHAAVPALMDLLGREAERLASLSTHSATLEDVFVHLTGTAPARCLSHAPSHPIVELTLARFREFLREPEAMFWTFAFPGADDVCPGAGLPLAGAAARAHRRGRGRQARAAVDRAPARERRARRARPARARRSSAPCAAAACTSSSCRRRR